jgi:hypothetical protein
MITEKIFTASQSFVIPSGITNLKTVSGFGGKGKDGYWAGGDFVQGGGDVEHITIYHRKDGTAEAPIYSYGTWTGDVVPERHYSYIYIGDSSTVYNYREYERLYTGTGSYYTVEYWVEETRGASTTGFGKTFLGGWGNVYGTPVTHNNVAVVSGSSHSLTIRSGTNITINY